MWCAFLATRGSCSHPQVTWDNVVFFVFLFLQFFKIFHVRLGKKIKNVSFLCVYVCVKAKLTLVIFFLL